jgi:hypothetical protein
MTREIYAHTKASAILLSDDWVGDLGRVLALLDLSCVQ